MIHGPLNLVCPFSGFALFTFFGPIVSNRILNLGCNTYLLPCGSALLHASISVSTLVSMTSAVVWDICLNVAEDPPHFTPDYQTILVTVNPNWCVISFNHVAMTSMAYNHLKREATTLKVADNKVADRMESRREGKMLG